MASDDDLQFYLDQLLASDQRVRFEAWTNLEEIAARDGDAMSMKHYRKMLDALRKERDESQAVAALRALAAAGPHVFPTAVLAATHPASRGRCKAAGGPEGRPGEPQSLESWFWAPFLQRSWILRVADPQRKRRDEEAVLEISRSLPREVFPHTAFSCVEMNGFAPPVAEMDDVKAVGFVGRLYMYGADAAESWRMKNPNPHYEFGMVGRPANLRPGEIHPTYHALVKDEGPNGKTRYRITDVNQVRTDYAIIQRYLVSWGGHVRTVVYIAGCCALGTLAAAQFAASALFRYGVDGTMIPAPEGISTRSCLEALIEVKANMGGFEFGWKPRDTRLLDLRVGDYVWCQAESQWQPLNHRTITVWFPRGASPENYRKDIDTIKVFFDGCQAELHAGSENRRLCVELCLLAKRQGGVVDLDQLGRETWIWTDGNSRSIAHVRNRLANVRRHFGASLVIDGNVCRITPEIVLEYDQSRRPR